MSDCALQASAGQRLLARQQAGGGSGAQQSDLYRRDGGSGSPAQRQAGSRYYGLGLVPLLLACAVAQHAFTF